MRITERRLRQLVRESLRHTLLENEDSSKTYLVGYRSFSDGAEIDALNELIAKSTTRGMHTLKPGCYRFIRYEGLNGPVSVETMFDQHVATLKYEDWSRTSAFSAEGNYFKEVPQLVSERRGFRFLPAGPIEFAGWGGGTLPVFPEKEKAAGMSKGYFVLVEGQKGQTCPAKIYELGGGFKKDAAPLIRTIGFNIIGRDAGSGKLFPLYDGQFSSLAAGRDNEGSWEQEFRKVFDCY